MDKYKVHLCVMLLPVCCVLGLSSSCSNSMEPLESRPWRIPLAAGNRWLFQVDEFDTSGSIQYSWTDSLNFERDTLIDGVTWSLMRITNTSLPGYLGFRSSASGVSQRIFSEYGPTSQHPMFLSPASVGQTYPTSKAYIGRGGFSFDDSSFTCTVVSLDRVITVPAGSFTCVQFRVTAAGVESYWADQYISPGYGWIRRDSYNKLRVGGPVQLVESQEAVDIRLR